MPRGDPNSSNNAEWIGRDGGVFLKANSETSSKPRAMTCGRNKRDRLVEPNKKIGVVLTARF